MKKTTAMVRTHVVLPKTLVKAIDSRVGKRRRSEFLAKLAEQEMKRQALMELLAQPGSLLDSSRHPEWENGSAAWVHTMRQQELHLETVRKKGRGRHARISA